MRTTSSMVALVTVVIALLLTPLQATATPAAGEDRLEELRELAPDTIDEARASFAQADQCRVDPTGDVDPPHALSGQSDITQFCGPTNGSFAFTMDLVSSPAPTSDPNWLYGITGWLVVWDGDGDGYVDFEILYWFDGTALVTDVYSAETGDLTCRGSATFAGKRLSSSVPDECLYAGGGSYFGIMFYDSQWDNPDAPVLYDDMTNSSPVAAPAPPPAPSPPPAPAPQPHTPATTARAVERLAGPSRIETSIAISRYQFPSGATEIYLSRSDEFADSISSGSLTRGPVLLVPQCGPVPTAVLEEVRRLNPSKVVPLGGTGAVCDQVVTDIANA